MIQGGRLGQNGHVSERIDELRAHDGGIGQMRKRGGANEGGGWGERGGVAGADKGRPDGRGGADGRTDADDGMEQTRGLGWAGRGME